MNHFSPLWCNMYRKMGVCIYCLNDSSASKSRAHIVPESFFRNDVTLPLGTECDACNNYASQLEQSFIYHNRIWTQIMMLRTPGKNGKKRKRMSHYSADDTNEMITIRFRPSWASESEGARKIRLPDPAEFSDSKFRRCLGHISLNYVAWKFGWQVALECRFDQLRNYVRFGSHGKKWPYGQISFEDSQPRKRLGIGWEHDAPGLTVKLESFIDVFYFDTLHMCELEDWIGRCDGNEVLYHHGCI